MKDICKNTPIVTIGTKNIYQKLWEDRKHS